MRHINRIINTIGPPDPAIPEQKEGFTPVATGSAVICPNTTCRLCRAKWFTPESGGRPVGPSLCPNCGKEAGIYRAKDHFDKNVGRKVAMAKALKAAIARPERRSFWEAYFDMRHETFLKGSLSKP